MLIGIDASRANKTNKTGVEWYAWHVIQNLKELTKDSEHSWVLYSNEVLQNGLEKLPKNWYEVRAHWPVKKGWTQVRLSYELWCRPTDVFFVPAHVLPRVSSKKSVVTIHDVGFRRLPQLYKTRDRKFHEWSTKDIAKRAERVITVSEFSGREISETYGIDPSKIAITPNGIDHDRYRPISDHAEIEERLTRYRIPKPYFVTIGRLEAKKNITNLVKAFTLFKARRGLGDPTKLVLIGNPGFGYEEIKKTIAESNAKQDILQLGYVPEADKPAILNGAQALIHPSWYEGFGIPPVEAMACGCPVLSSNAASLPEIIGKEAGIYFTPGELESMAHAMARIQDESGLASRLRTAGIAQAAKYTWRNTAELTLPVLTQW
ncbi:MAG: glycosyltransferase family 1 protein [Patescibacteria group bacterium]|nr:glycosyltransferase family 1 protein [Patescibacteria group bacterium]